MKLLTPRNGSDQNRNYSSLNIHVEGVHERLMSLWALKDICRSMETNGYLMSLGITDIYQSMSSHHEINKREGGGDIFKLTEKFTSNRECAPILWKYVWL